MARDNLNDQMRALTKAIERSNQLAAKASVGTGSGGMAASAMGAGRRRGIRGFGAGLSAARGFGRGGFRGLMGGGIRVGVAGAVVGAAKFATENVIGPGVMQWARGGSFQGGAGRSLINAAGGTFIGEALGFKKVAGTLEGAQQDLNQVTNQVARFAGAGAITPKVRDFLADRAVVQNKNIQDDREKNKAAINQPGRLKLAAAGEDMPTRMLEAMDRIRQVLESIAAGFPGGSN